MIFLEEEFRAFCPTGEGGGIKNDCSAKDGGGGPSPKTDNSWKREQGRVQVSGKDLKKSPPAKSLAGVKSVTIMDGELVSKSLREVGVTLDQAAKACAALDPESDVVIAHGGMREIIEYMGSDNPERFIEDTVTFTSTMPVAGIEGAAKTAASLTRFEDGELVMSYTMLMISDEAKEKASVAVARHMMKGTIASITQAEKIGVTSVEMLAAGDNRDSSDFKGYRIWPRLGFNGVIPRQRITPTWSLARGFFNSYGSGIPDKILSPRARKEKAAGALTIQSLYETKEGQEWWEKNGGEMEMSLNVGDAKDPGWKRFTSLRDRFSKRGLDLADAFFDVEARALLDDDWVEYRNGGCEKVEGGRFAPGNDCASDGSGGSSSKTDDSWKESNDSVSLSGNDLKEKPPFAGAEKAGRVEIANPKALLEGMAQAGIKSLDDLAAMGGATVRGSEVVFSGAGHPEMGAYLSVENKIPVSRSGDGSEGYFQVGVSVYKEGREHVLGLNEMFPTQEVKASRERVAKATSLMQQAVIESIMAADNSGIARVKMSAAGGPEYDLKGYRLWPQFGFDAPLEPSHKHALAKAPPDVIEKVMRVARPDLFATRIKPSAGALAAALPQSNINVQHLVSFHEGDLWWDNNGSTLGMVLDLSDKKSLGYAKFQKRVSQLKKLRERNQERSFFQWLDEEAEFRAGADCGRVEGGRFGSGNDCASEDGADSLPADDDGGLEMDSEAVSASPPFKGAEVLDSFSVNDVHSLKGLLGDLGKVKTVENVVAISGGARQGGSISVDSYGESIIVNSSIPVSPDGSDQLGSIKNMVSLMKDDDGNLVVAYDSMSLDSKAMSSIDGESEGDSADRRRIVSLVLERMTESMSVAEKSGAVRADTIAAGNSGSALQGYRLWPQFGFDGLLDRADVDAIKADVKLTPEQRRRANSGSMTVQQLIATPEGDRWWNENGTTIELSFDFTNKESVGYKRFERMKKMLERLKERNKNRSEFVDGVEQRDAGCEKTEGGRFAKGNDCAKGDGSGSEGNRTPQRDPARAVTADVVSSPPTVRSPDGKTIVSTSVGSREDGTIYKFGGVEYVSTVSAGEALVAKQAEERRGKINTATKKLSAEDRKYIVDSISEQAEAAMSRGIKPAFYSREEARRQIEAHSQIIPEILGGRTRDGTEVSPENAEHLFRALQSLTSPNAMPFGNMQRTDSLLQKFFYGDGRLTTSTMFGVTGNSIKKSLQRYQAIVDTLGRRTDGSIDTAEGLRRTREMFDGKVMRAGDFEDFFREIIGEDDDNTWKPGSYLVDEEIPLFCTFGPKVGTFYANNNGELDHLTADIWWTRTWGRVTGELVIPPNPSSGKKHAASLAKEIVKASPEQLHGHDLQQLLAGLKETAKTGATADTVRAWAGDRFRHYAAGDYSEKKGLGGRLNKLAKNIVENDVSLMGDPGAGSRRANMISVAREAAKRVGQPVAYMQDILWQDEQDAYAALGAKTATGVGTLSLYSDQIERLAKNPEDRLPRAKQDPKDRRSVDAASERHGFDDYDRGGREQMLYEAAISKVSDEDFARLVIALAEKASRSKKESRAFCPTGEGGGVDNSCGSDEGSSSPESSSSRSPESMPRSFPRGSEKLRDAIDSVSPNPKAVWDRSRGRADTPPEKVITAAADEQGSSGASLTPEAEASYKDLIDEIGRQYEALTAAGLKAKAWRGEGEPYGDPPGSTKPNSDKMREEVAKTGEFSFFMTEKGFGTGSATPDHPMLRETKYKTADGEPMIANDLFRVVHDMVAHVRGGYSFSTNGEYNGMLTHASTLPESAWPALFAETFGQNAVYEKTGNYAPQNAYASKVGPEIIKAELAKRNRKVRRAIDAEYESDDPLGYQHLKVRPWLMKGVTESRAYCPTGDGGGIDNSCSASDKGKEPIPAGDKSLKSYEPFTPNESTRNSDFAILPSDEEAAAALKEPQREKYGAHRTLPAGYPLDLRIDIPAFENHGAYVVTAHEHVNGAGVGAPVGYDSIIRLKGDVDFRVGETAATKIARGKTSKNTHSTVKGKFDPSRDIPEDIDDWTPVGYNPKTATYYYDKRNGKEIVGGVDSISVGNSVFVRIPKYGNGRDPSAPPRNAKADYRSADCGRDESGKFGSGNDCAADEGGGQPKEAAFKSSFVNTKKYIPGEEELKQRQSFAGISDEYARSAGLLSSPPDKSFADAADSQLIQSEEVMSALKTYTSNWMPQGVPKVLSERVSRATLPKGTPAVFRGMRLKHKELDRIISQGAVSHSAVNSWSFSPSVAGLFATPMNPWSKDYATVVLVNDSPRRGLVNPNGAEEFELIAPAGEQKIAKVVRASGPEGSVVFLHLRRDGAAAKRSDTGPNALVVSNSEWSRFLSVPQERAASRRSADCGRDESGKFGSGNDCASDGSGGGTATAAPSGDRWSSNETLSWPETSRDTSPPPVGDGRYGSINVSAPKAVKASLDAAGIDPKLAPMVAGGSEESDVFVRPAPDFSMEFPDSKVTPVMFAFERDFAGVESGLHGSSVIGVTASGETVVYHSTVNVADSIKSDDSKRHAAAREFYRAMTSSVEAARKAGVSRIVLNAAGNSSATKGSVTSTPWRGYTIWPRMGFDAPLPASIKAKLPPDLSHAKSLLDLHATPEGTRWWRDNGEDLDVSFDLKDRSSPQAKIMDRFIKKFGESRREMPLGSGDEWMSPEDLVRLDEMWQEIWEDGELDDYEWVESRSADCGRDEGGRFDQGNQCQRGAGKVAALAKSGASHEELTAAIAEAIGTKRGWFTGPEAGESSPSEVCEALGLNVANDWIVNKYHAESTQYTREAIAKTIAEVYAAVQAVPSLKDVEFHIQTAQSIAKHTGTSQFRWEGVQGAYLPVDNEIHILAGTTDSQITPEFLHKSGYSSTPSPAHTLVHEDVHREHYENAAAKTGSPRPPKHATEEQVYRWATGLKMDIMRNLEVAAMRDPAWIYRCESKVEKLGFYATTDPLEFVAEYATAVKLGYAKNDPDLDKMCKAMLAPVPRKAKA